MNGLLSPPVRRGLAIAIFVVLIAVIYFGVVQPLAGSYTGHWQTVVQLQDAVAKYRRAAEELPALQAQLTTLTRDQSSTAGFLQGPSATLIAAHIQNRIKSLADAAKVDLRTSQVLPAAEEGKLQRIAVREQLAGSLGGILAVVDGLEAAGSPFLFLDNLSIRVRLIAARDRKAPTSDETLDVQFDVYGYAHSAS
jgi:hypothetical protein